MGERTYISPSSPTALSTRLLPMSDLNSLLTDASQLPVADRLELIEALCPSRQTDQTVVIP